MREVNTLAYFVATKKNKFYKAWAYMSGAAYGNWLYFYLPVLDYSEKSFKKEANTLAYFVMTKKNEFNQDWAYTCGATISVLANIRQTL